MKLQLIRNATLRLTYAGRVILIDPYFAEQFSAEPLVGISRNPLTPLPLPEEQILDGIEVVIVSHLHPDHFDERAKQLVPKNLLLYCQPGDKDTIVSYGFRSVTVVQTGLNWGGITFTRTEGNHGVGIWLERMGPAAGFLIQAPGEPTLYWAGDTIWYEGVAQTIADHSPDVIVTHSSGARWEADAPTVIMDAPQTLEVCRAAPRAVVVATHMETFDFDTVSRADLRAAADKTGITPRQLRIPADGETLTIQ